jgi:SAM-dependent methyltransferase
VSAETQHGADRIELLSVDLLVQERERVREFLDIYESLGLVLGWHYLLDLPWATRHLDARRGDRVLDAGAGLGLMQWWLARRGVDVVAVDTNDRANLDAKFRSWCPVRGLRDQDLNPVPQPGWRSYMPPWRPWQWQRWPAKLRSATASRRRVAAPPRDRGTVTIYTQNLADMRDVADDSVDGIVSISALEHNTPAGLRVCVAELMRVLKPGGRLVATLGAAKDKDWFHEPSHGWCYTEATLRDIFALPDDAPSNYDRFDTLLQALRESEELRRRLDPVYAASGSSGMPWGVWDPKYLSVGVVKTKR